MELSSYGPTADGRLKPNVCNFYYVSAVDPESDYSWSSYANGTSFSTPLTAGFCACAWQLNRSLTAMQLKAEVEKSADLYPYYDYALGYGVPQASYFTDPERRIKDTTFVLEDSAEYIRFKPLSYDSSNFIFLHVRDSNGLVEKYRENSFGTYMIDSINPLLIPKSCIGDRILCVCYNGYVSEFRLNDSDRVKYRDEYRADEKLIVQNRHSRINHVDLSRTLA
ncbi:MAG: S8 family serine peptidase, partial [Bacteroidales bacterium]|nr:S8 family serine peptidase [Bacteroidales bacterium]